MTGSLRRQPGTFLEAHLRRAENAGAFARLFTAGSDIVLILDLDGKVREVAIADELLARTVGDRWTGRLMADIVTAESQGKVGTMLSHVGEAALQHEINHAMEGGSDLPVRYTALRLAPDGPVAAIGRHLREITQLQQRLLDAALLAEQDYALQRATELQFRVLFQNIDDAVIIADAASRQIVEVNPRAEDVLKRGARHLVGAVFESLFVEADAQAIGDGFMTMRALGQAAWRDLTLRTVGRRIAAAGWFIQGGAQPQVLLRLDSRYSPEDVEQAPDPVWQALRSLPEAYAVVDAQTQILDANVAFLELVEAPALDRVAGEPLWRVLDGPLENLHPLEPRIAAGEMTHLSASIRVLGREGSVPVEVIAVTLGGGSAATGRLLIHLRPKAAEAAAGKMPLKAPEEMTDLVGRVPLRDIVRETADIVEELCIEAALELTNDNRASAAEMLGLSRQSLYSKLRRYGMGDLPGEVRPSA